MKRLEKKDAEFAAREAALAQEREREVVEIREALSRTELEKAEAEVTSARSMRPGRRRSLCA